MNNYGCESDPNMMRPCVDITSIENRETLEEAIGRLAEMINQFMLETKVTLQVQQMMLTTLGLQLDNLVGNSIPIEEQLDILQEECAKEEGTKDLKLNIDSGEELYGPEVVEPPSYITVTKDFIWPTPPLPTPKAIIHAQQPCEENWSLVGSTCYKRNYHAKLEGTSIQEPWVVLYDTFYGRKPLFDESRRCTAIT